MKTVLESINFMINEEFGCQTITDIFEKIKLSCKESYLLSVIKRAYTWDKIEEKDIGKVDASQGKKLSYKRNASNTLIWFNSNDEFVGLTIGNYSWYKNNSILGNIKNMMPIVYSSTYAYHIINAEKFETQSIRRKRQQNKDNALALKSNEEIRDENINRYKTILSKMSMEKTANMAHVQARFEEVMQRYQLMFDKIVLPQDGESMNKFFMNLRNVSELMTQVLNAFYGYTDNYMFVKNLKDASQHAYDALIEQLKTIDYRIEKLNKHIDTFID